MPIVYDFLKLKSINNSIGEYRMIIVNIIGLALIAIVIWWFWLYKPTKVADASFDDITIIVNNGVYQPSRIKIVAGKETRLKFLRKDGSSCAEMVQFPDLELTVELPIGVSKSVELPAMLAGEYAFHCSMKMYIGTLVVE
jgi:plastocyanin domain-containing protein